MSKKAIEAAIRRREWVRLRHGAYTFRDVWDAWSDDQRYVARARAAARTARTRVVISHTPALLIHELPVWDADLDNVHLTRRDGKTGRVEAGVMQHRGRLRDDEIVEVGGSLVTTATRTILDIMTIWDTEHALPTLDAALHAKLIDEDVLAREVELRRFWPGSNNAIVLLGLSDGRAGSVAESRTRYLCWKHGLPAPEPQFEVRTPDGRLIGQVDLAWPEYGVFVEFDGRIKYDSLVPQGQTALDVILAEKRRSELICERTGWICIRLTWADLSRPQATANRIAAALRSRLSA